MITHLTRQGWEVIYHRAHALLAAQIAGHWQRKNAPQRLYETIAAISHHDDLAKEWEGNQLTPAGAPLDFTLSQEMDFESLKIHAAEALYRGRWVALLTSKHISFLMEGLRGESKELDQFLDEQKEHQQAWRKELEISDQDVEDAYGFMQFCDRLSLILCQGQLPEGNRALEICLGPGGVRYDVVQLEEGKVTVLPWPFEDKEFTVNVEACCLDQLKFASNEELKAALKTAPRSINLWTFVKQ